MRSDIGKNVLSQDNEGMQIEEITLSLKERGVVWQAVGFAVFGTASLAALSVYSDSHHWIITTYRTAATELNWAYIAIIALAIEGVRKVFEKATEIRRRYSEQADAKAREKGERETVERMMSILDKHGIQLPPEAEAEIRKNGHRS